MAGPYFDPNKPVATGQPTPSTGPPKKKTLHRRLNKALPKTAQGPINPQKGATFAKPGFLAGGGLNQNTALDATSAGPMGNTPQPFLAGAERKKVTNVAPAIARRLQGQKLSKAKKKMF